MLRFEAPKGTSSIIKVIGVGGGGNNAVNHMFTQGIVDVDFIQCNTDAQILDASPVPAKVQLGTSGLGAGNRPEVGRKAAEETIEKIREILETNTKMLFITAGMGGGTGTGAAPVIASVARELDILTVGIVTIPFSFEGRKRKLQAEQGIDELRKYVDTLLVINNDKLREFYGDLKLTQAFSHADDVLTRAAKGIAEIITVKAYINVDFEDVKTVMKNSGKAIMGSSIATGENRATKAAIEALASPLLNDSNIGGARNMLLYIASGRENEITMDEVSEITDYIQESAGNDVDIIWGVGFDDNLGEAIGITLIATAFETSKRPEAPNAPERNIIPLDSPAPLPNENHDPVKKTEDIHLIHERPEVPSVLSEPYTPEKQVLREYPNTAADPPHIRTVHNLFDEGLPTAVDNSQVQDSPLPQTRLQEEAPKTSNPEPEAQIPESYNKNRIEKLRTYSTPIRSLDDLEELESKPAYARRNAPIQDTPPSSESEISKTAIKTYGDNRPELRSNTFLFENPD